MRRYLIADEVKLILPLIAIAGLVGSLLTYSSPVQARGIQESITPEQTLVAAQPDISALLLSLPKPKEFKGKLTTMFTANAYQQKAVNFQVKLKPEDAVKFYQEELTKKGYTERTINTQVGQWGFNLVFDVPKDVHLTPVDASKTVVLVLQGTMLSADTININIRFEEI